MIFSLGHLGTFIMRGTCPDATQLLSSSASWRTLGANTETSQTDLSSEVLAHMDKDLKPAQTLTPSHILTYANTCRLKMRETNLTIYQV
jgi:hypothetical protein